MRTINNRDRDAHEALLGRAGRVGRGQANEKDPWDVVETHEIHTSKGSISLSCDIQRMHHHCTNQTKDCAHNPKDTTQVRNEEGNGGEDRLADHGHSCLGRSHKHGLCPAEAVTRNDEWVEISDARIGDSISKDSKPDAIAFGVTESFPDLGCMECLLQPVSISSCQSVIAYNSSPSLIRRQFG